MNRTGIKNYQIGETFTGFCIVRKKELKHKHNGEPYLVLELGDKSGRLRSKLWKDTEKFFKNLKAGELIKVKGKLQSFQDTKELKIERLRKAKPEEKKIASELLPCSKKDIEGLKDKFYEHLHTIKNTYLKDLMQVLFGESEIQEEYFKSPSGKLWHHNYLYGVLEHTVCLLDLSEILKLHYPDLEMDLLKSAIILHNLGKKVEYGREGFIDYSREGRLLGNVTLGYDMVTESIEKIEDFPDELKIQLLHLILSHRGDKDNNSPVLPMTLEAVALHHLDELDIQLNAVQRIMENDRLPDSDWTRYNNLLNRFLYLGGKSLGK